MHARCGHLRILPHGWIQGQFGIEKPMDWKASQGLLTVRPIGLLQRARGDSSYGRHMSSPLSMFPRDKRAHIFKADELAFAHWHYVRIRYVVFYPYSACHLCEMSTKKEASCGKLSCSQLTDFKLRLADEQSKSLRMETLSSALHSSTSCFKSVFKMVIHSVSAVKFGRLLLLPWLRASDKPRLYLFCLRARCQRGGLDSTHRFKMVFL